jgi:sugar transferase (PEP-CTERM/EpsH1 system associated)
VLKLGDEPVAEADKVRDRSAPLASASPTDVLSNIGRQGIVPSDGSFPLRILHVLNQLGTGGTEHAVLNVVSRLPGSQFEHRFCVIRKFDREFALNKNLPAEPFVAGERDAWFFVFRLARIMKAYRPHIVHSRNWGAIEAIPAARLARVPIVIHSEHGYEVETIDRLPKRQQLLRRVVYPMADAVFTVTEELREYHAEQARFSPAKIRVLQNGVDTDRFSPCPEIRQAVRARLGLTPAAMVVGSVGRMVPIKDYATLLKAAACVIARGVDLRVLLVGSGPELEKHRAFAAETPELAGRVVFLGATENVSEVLNAMDLFVLPSLLEGMSNTLLEAMATGLPVVATRVGGNPELVVDGVTGWLFERGDVSELARRIEELTGRNELRCRFGDAARKRAEQQFSLRAMIERYQSLYLDLAEKKKLISPRSR